MSREQPPVGEETSLEVEVTEEMLVNLAGRRIHPLYSTVSMVEHMEVVSRMLIEPHFAEGEDATGYAVSVVHERPARVGDRLRVTARLTKIDEREAETVAVVEGPAGRIGIGTLVQRYIRAGLFTEGSG
ncbi:MAG TPA: thioesterase [Actinomycetota bacterium]|nr:thioesterase [Actinomycetota bacterium]